MVLHDWPDAAAARILRTVHAAVPPGTEGATTLLVQDIVMSDGPTPGTLQTILDLQMLAITGGRERTQREWEALLASGGFKLAAVHKLRAVPSLLEARPV